MTTPLSSGLPVHPDVEIDATKTVSARRLKIDTIRFRHLSLIHI